MDFKKIEIKDGWKHGLEKQEKNAQVGFAVSLVSVIVLAAANAVTIAVSDAIENRNNSA